MPTVLPGSISPITASASDPNFIVSAARVTSFTINAPAGQTIPISVTFNGSAGATMTLGTGINATISTSSTSNGWNVNGANSGAMTLNLTQSGSLGTVTAPTNGPFTATLSGGAAIGNVTLGTGNATFTLADGTQTGVVTAGTGPISISGEGTIGGIQSTGALADLITITDATIAHTTVLGGTIQTGAGADILNIHGNVDLTRQTTGSLIDTGADNDQILISSGSSLIGRGLGSKSVDMDAGNDLFSLGANASAEDFTLDLGEGNDRVEIGDNAIFTGSVYLGSGAFSDFISLGLGAKLEGSILSNSTGPTTVEIGNDAEIGGDIDIDTASLTTINLGTGVTMGGRIDILSTATTEINIGQGSTIGGGIVLGIGDDTVTAGDNVTVTGWIDLEEGNNHLTFGDNAVLTGLSSISILGDSGNDVVTFGSGATIAGNISLFQGDNTVVIGDGAHLSETGSVIVTTIGEDNVTLGDMVTIDGSIHLGGGNDRLTIGADLIAGRIGIVIDGGTDVSGFNQDTLHIAYTPELRLILSDAGSGYSLIDGQWQYTGLPGANIFLYGGITFRDFEIITTYCFTPGTLMRTDRGDQRVEDLGIGDLVETLDHGLQPIRKILRRRLSAHDLRLKPRAAPIAIQAGALGEGLPLRDLVLSPQHRVLISSAIAKRMTDHADLLVPAVALLNHAGVTRVQAETVDYIHLVFDQHELIYSEGALTEAFYPGDLCRQESDRATRDELFAIFPQLRDPDFTYATCRPILKGAKAKQMIARHEKNQKPLVALLQ